MRVRWPWVVTIALILPISLQAQTPASNDFELNEATVEQLQQWMSSGRYTSRRLVDLYLDRIAAIDKSGPTLQSVIELNPDARSIADELDRERQMKGPRGPLHGIPVLVKDNIDTADKMATSAGSLALEHSIAAEDAFVVRQLRTAGVVIVGKTNLSEWANFRSTNSTSGWSARGGQVKNPYALDRNPCGSSSGTAAAIAANLAVAGVGTETDGSIVCPSAVNALVGIKPTVGLVSRSGIIPISHSQDTAGPIARTVADAALLLTAMTGRDPRDATIARAPHPVANYNDALDTDALKGARIGVARKRYFGYSAGTDELVEDAIRTMKAHGAIVVDPADIATAAQIDDCEKEVLLFEFKSDLNKYLGALPPSVPVHSLKELIAFDEREAARELAYFGQDLFIAAQRKGPLSSPAYKKALATCRTRARTRGIDAVMTKHRLDALIAPTTSPAWPTDLINGDHFTGASSTPAAVAGYPSITVPVGAVHGLPVGMAFIGRAWSEAKLIGLAYAFEQATKARRAPAFLPTVGLPDRADSREP
jgi:amidase